MTIKVYRYISDTKVNMIYHQIPKRFLNKISVKLNVKIPMLDVELTKKSSENLRYKKCKAIIGYLEENESIGTVDLPQLYFKGTLDMKWGRIGPGNTQILLFSSIKKNIIIGLIGSIRHQIGSTPEIGHISIGGSALGALGRGLEEEEDFKKPEDYKSIKPWMNEYGYEYIAKTIKKWYKPPFQKLNFYAIRLLQINIRKSKKSLIIGSPIYVALE